MTFWNEQPAPVGDFPEQQVKFTAVGVGIAGQVTNMRWATFDNGKVPELWIRDANGVEWQMLCGQSDLWLKLEQHQIAIGDMLAVQYSDEKKLGGGKARKLFTVQVRKGNGVSAQPTPQPTPTKPMLMQPTPQSTPPERTADVQTSIFDGASEVTLSETPEPGGRSLKVTRASDIKPRPAVALDPEGDLFKALGGQ